MHNRIKIYVVVGLLFFLSACYNNTIYYDVDTNSIATCNGIAINWLLFTQEHHYKAFIIEKIDNEKGTNRFRLDSINKAYRIYENNKQISVDSFRLEPNEEYHIENHTNGDAASGRLTLRTDVQAKIIKTDITSCN